MGRTAGVVALLGWLLAACGGPEAPAGPAVQRRSVRGVYVVLETDAPFARAPDFDGRLQRTIEASLRYWGGSWALVEGRTVVIVDEPGVDCGGKETLGCSDAAGIRFTSRDPGLGTVACVEQTVLAHEIGHVVLGDPDHTDPRWMELDPLAAELAGAAGYTDGGVTACDTHVSVWRHPLGTP